MVADGGREPERGRRRPAFSIRVHIRSNYRRESVDKPAPDALEATYMKLQQLEVDPKLIKITPDLVRRVNAWKGGKSTAGKTSPAKRKASRENGKKGGRPKRAQMEWRLK